MRKLTAAVVAFGPAFVALPAIGATLDDVAEAMGTFKTDSIAYSGSGSAYAVGQSPNPAMPWPRFNLIRYTAAADYEKAAMTESMTVTQGETPPRGGGRQPVRGEMTRGAGVSGDTGWSVFRGRASARGPAAMQHKLWTTPHGVVKLGIRDKARLTTMKSGKSVFSVARAGRFRALATVNAANMVEKVESWVNNPVFGDMHVVTTYAAYKGFGDTKFPTRISQTAGGLPSLVLNVTEVRANAGAVKMPERIAPPRRTVKVDKAADGVFYLTGGSHHSIAVEMADHIVVVEGPLGDGRANGVIAAAKKAIPGKPIRFVVNTHHHFDHSGGLRAFAAEGAAIVTHEINKPFYERVYAAPRTLSPDSLTKSGKTARFRTVNDKLVLSDGKRSLEIHHVKGNLHNEGLLIAYLPAEKIMMVADAFSYRRELKAPAKVLNPFTANLWQNVQRLKLDIATILPIHGRKAPIEQLKLAAGVQ